MNNMGNQDVIDAMLSDMRNHVSSLQKKLSVADAAINKSQTVNDKIVIMKEYHDKVSTINSCWRSKNRKGLVANLQHENRQMLALEEENRKLRFALKEMEEGLQLIMADYRRVISGFTRSNTLLEFVEKQFNQEVEENADCEKVAKLAAVANQCLAMADNRIFELVETIAELRVENETLRELAYFKPKLSSTTTDTAYGGRFTGYLPTSDGSDKFSGKNLAEKGRKIPNRSAAVNGKQNRTNDNKEAAKASSNGNQYSWPIHAFHVYADGSKNPTIMTTDEDGMKLAMAAARKALLPRENPARRSGASPRTSVASCVQAGSPIDVPVSSAPSNPDEVPNDGIISAANLTTDDTQWTTVPPTAEQANNVPNEENISIMSDDNAPHPPLEQKSADCNAREADNHENSTTGDNHDSTSIASNGNDGLRESSIPDISN